MSQQRVGLSCKSDQNVCGSDKNILFLGVTQHNRILTRTKVLLATETQRKIENVDDISFRSGVYSSTDDVTIVFCRRHIYIDIFIYIIQYVIFQVSDHQFQKCCVKVSLAWTSRLSSSLLEKVTLKLLGCFILRSLTSITQPKLDKVLYTRQP